jgi:hypothetical protein
MLIQNYNVDSKLFTYKCLIISFLIKIQGSRLVSEPLLTSIAVVLNLKAVFY